MEIATCGAPNTSIRNGSRGLLTTMQNLNFLFLHTSNAFSTFLVCWAMCQAKSGIGWRAFLTRNLQCIGALLLIQLKRTIPKKRPQSWLTLT